MFHSILRLLIEVTKMETTPWAFLKDIIYPHNTESHKSKVDGVKPPLPGRRERPIVIHVPVFSKTNEAKFGFLFASQDRIIFF